MNLHWMLQIKENRYIDKRKELAEDKKQVHKVHATIYLCKD